MIGGISRAPSAAGLWTPIVAPQAVAAINASSWTRDSSLAFGVYEELKAWIFGVNITNGSLLNFTWRNGGANATADSDYVRTTHRNASIASVGVEDDNSFVGTDSWEPGEDVSIELRLRKLSATQSIWSIEYVGDYNTSGAPMRLEAMGRHETNVDGFILSVGAGTIVDIAKWAVWGRKA